jgi:uncharacterized membrane protein
MLRRIRRSIIAILSFSIMTPVLAHEALEHILGYRHETGSSWGLVGVVLTITALIFVVSLLLKAQKKDSNK